MQISLALFQLIRFKNLLILGGSQVLIKYVLLAKYIHSGGLSNTLFSLLVIATVFIAAGGYAINDIVDNELDLINKKNKVIIGIHLSKRTATRWVWILMLSGVFIGSYLSLQIDQPLLFGYFLFAIILLILYSLRLKEIPLLGNIIVALLIATSIFMVGVFEDVKFDSTVFHIIFLYSAFAFGFNLLREIIKDLEDIDGDAAHYLKTLPIVLGRKRTNSVVFVGSCLIAVGLAVVLLMIDSNELLLKLYAFVLVLIPLVYFIYKLQNAKTKKDYHKLSTLLKIIMVLGLISLLLI